MHRVLARRHTVEFIVDDLQRPAYQVLLLRMHAYACACMRMPADIGMHAYAWEYRDACVCLGI